MNASKSKFAICRHIKTNGRVCQSPALTGGALCYFHRNLHHTHRRPAEVEPLFSQWQEDEIQATDPTGEDILIHRSVYPHQDDIRFPALEDAESVQLATSMLFQAIATGQISFKRARLLLYTLKVACINQRALANSRAAESDAGSLPARIIRTPEGQILAAPDDDAPTEAAAEIGTPAPSPVFDEVDHGVTHTPTQPDSPQSAVSPEPSTAPTVSAVTPPTNPNENRNLDISHLDTGFRRKRHPANN